jgi:hypothetical protein
MAFEMLQLRVLNTQLMFPTPQFSGQPLRGNDADKQNTLLISRVACFGLLRHRQIGYTGPLSRHLLAYHQMASAVRESLRDLLESHACGLLMSGAVSRESIDGGITVGDYNRQLTSLGCNLPFIREPDLGLALVVKSYLDEQSNEQSKRQDIGRWFSHVQDMDGDLEKAFKLWDCVSLTSAPCAAFGCACPAVLTSIVGQRRCAISAYGSRKRDHEEGVQVRR